MVSFETRVARWELGLLSLLPSTCYKIVYVLFMLYYVCRFSTEAARVPLLWAAGPDPTSDTQRQELLPGVSTTHSSSGFGPRGPAGWRDTPGGVVQRGFHLRRERWVKLSFSGSVMPRQRCENLLFHILVYLLYFRLSTVNKIKQLDFDFASFCCSLLHSVMSVITLLFQSVT